MRIGWDRRGWLNVQESDGEEDGCCDSEECRWGFVSVLDGRLVSSTVLEGV